MLVVALMLHHDDHKHFLRMLDVILFLEFHDGFLGMFLESVAIPLIRSRHLHWYDISSFHTKLTLALLQSLDDRVDVLLASVSVKKKDLSLLKALRVEDWHLLQQSFTAK